MKVIKENKGFGDVYVVVNKSTSERLAIFYKKVDANYYIKKVDKEYDDLMAKAILDCIEMDKEAGITSENRDCLD